MNRAHLRVEEHLVKNFYLNWDEPSLSCHFLAKGVPIEDHMKTHRINFRIRQAKTSIYNHPQTSQSRPILQRH